MNEAIYGIIIIGGGPAGLTAGLYGSRAGMKTLLLEKGIFGGQITYAEQVENFPGFPEGISGMELGEKMRRQAGRFGLEIIETEATGVEIEPQTHVVLTSDGKYECRALILAGGSNRRKLAVPGEMEYTGRGVSYCATCDAAFFRDLPVVVVGGGDTALAEALHLTHMASEVTLIHRRDQLRATRVLQQRAFENPKMKFVWNTTVTSVEGDGAVNTVKLHNVKSGENTSLATAGVFIAVGFLPDTEFIKNAVNLDDTGHIITNEMMETSRKGIFAAGDIRRNSGKQAVIAAGDGATAAIYAQKYITENFSQL